MKIDIASALNVVSNDSLIGKSFIIGSHGNLITKSIFSSVARKRVFFTLLFMLFFPWQNIYSQNLQSLEKKHDDINTTLTGGKRNLDSLKKILNQKAELINTEKKKTNPDQDKILSLMSGSASLSNKIESHQKNIDRLEKDIEEIKKKLDEKYSQVIDSLEAIKKSGKEDVEKIDSEILFYTEKKLLAIPKIPMLSFNPEKILKVNLSNTKDEKEKNIYREYLQTAYNEVNSLLQNINEKSEETAQIIALQKRTKKFLEESEFESGIIARSSETEQKENLRVDVSNSFSFEKEAVIPQIQAYNLLLNQLNLNQSYDNDLKWRLTIERIGSNFNIEDYQSLLKEVKKRLQDYKLVLANKLGFK